ncbi:uncharacterized protein LOC109727399 isoform X1 [Ananas comosus]|uniref:Uncharacterized protein LOC109727399 isoform X1 n=1 Tax=Ananas comosus TaxID=4615 RepID=A0A6P5GZ75_ANACO|nr:uncharacterized protein LOC109727399 isoform X1 [Ananas comosus]
MDVDPSLAYRDYTEYGKREAVRQLQLIKALYTMDFIHFGMPLDEIIEKLKEHKVISTSNVGLEGSVNQRFSRLLCVRQREAYYRLLEKLVSFSPYIQWDDECDEKLEWLNENGHLPSLCVISFFFWKEFCDILCFMERRFHPLIREGHKDVLLAVIKRRSIGARREVEQGFERYGCLLTTHSDFIENYIEERKHASKRLECLQSIHLGGFGLTWKMEPEDESRRRQKEYLIDGELVVGTVFEIFGWTMDRY